MEILPSEIKEFGEEIMRNVLEAVAKLDRVSLTLTRIGLAVVTLWIGGLKVVPYEAEGIAPFVANSPIMSWLYNDPSGYKSHRNPEGALVAANKDWHAMNGSYVAALLIGATIVAIGLLILGHWIHPVLGVIGGVALTGMSFVTLSFLVTTPEAWVPALGSAEHGFPYLSGVGRLVIKDSIMLGASLVVAVDSARCALARM
ncbi:YkgB family protein [Dermatophilus congolensis]|uniref:YkgB family protein n=1 Tax=Dermatophilus congolensis TaxID=1863 RepID=UPI00215D8487|nr:YkgB family protein [Dermatophilus congolensis]